MRGVARALEQPDRPASELEISRSGSVFFRHNNPENYHPARSLSTLGLFFFPSLITGCLPSLGVVPIRLLLDPGSRQV